MAEIPDYATTDDLVAEIDRLGDENNKLRAEVTRLKKRVNDLLKKD